MMRVAVLLTALVAALTLAGTASSFDRHPIKVRGLRPDGWGNTVTAGERQLRHRYPGIEYDYCVGVVLAGYPLSDSYWIHGMVRAWDKLACGGYTHNGKAFTLIEDRKGQYRWVIYRLHGASTPDLQR
jgi:hypothetical protein